MSPNERPRPYAERVRRLGVRGAPLRDLYHHFLTASWAKVIAIIFVAYVASNAVFGIVYWLDGGVENLRPGSYLDAFFFSVQTMATIGYGKMTPVSLVAHVCVAIEAFFGLVGFTMATGLMIAKFARPRARVVWTKHAVVTVRDGKTSLLVRLGNERSTGMIEASLRLVFLRNESTAEGESIRRMSDLALVRQTTAMFALTWTAVHVIDEKSPLFGETAQSLRESQAEIVASLVGLEEASAQTVHARKIWRAEEVVFGKRFADVLGTDPSGRPTLDYSRFHEITDDLPAQK